jgi:hypothetical protein
VLGHTSNIVGQRGDLIAGLGRVEPEELSQSRAVLRILVDTKLNVLAKSSVEFVELLTVLGNLVEHLESLLDNVLADDLHNLVLLKGLTGQVERQILRVDNTLDETEPLRNKISGIISDENTANVELNVVLGALSLEKIERSTLGNEKDSTEFKLTLNGEVLNGKVVFPVVGERLVERSILLVCDVCRIPSPDRLGLVELFLLLLDLLDFLGLLFLLLFVFIDLQLKVN